MTFATAHVNIRLAVFVMWSCQSLRAEQVEK